MTINKAEKFKDFLTARGAEILMPTNEYEVIRFKANDKVSVVYRGRRGFSFIGEAGIAFEAFEKNGSWTSNNRIVNRVQKRSVKARTIRERDGDACFYCGQSIATEDESMEHLLASAHGGTNHISNLVLAHKKCNVEGGHMTIIMKVKKREEMLLASSVEKIKQLNKEYLNDSR